MLDGQEVAAVVVAAGRSTRMGFDKLFYPIEGVEVIRHAVSRMDGHPDVDRVVIVAGDNIDRVQALFNAHPLQKPLVIVEGGQNRVDSVAAGVAACPTASIVAIHDGARPFPSPQLISRTINAVAETGAAAPGIAVKDTIKMVDEGNVVETIPRSRLLAIQTPQVFNRTAFTRALAFILPEDYPNITDDCMVMELAGHKVTVVQGEEGNRKITTREDLRGTTSENTDAGAQRIGQGYDVHRLVEGRRLILGGVDIEHETGLLGHSDADVLLHAVMDALLGAACLGDIGRHFPDTDEGYKGANSMALLSLVAGLLRKKGFEICNIDATVVCQRPRLSGHIPAMQANIAAAAGTQPDRVNVKATTEEGLGITGEGAAIAAHCVALIKQQR